jgi:hypothetical protein
MSSIAYPPYHITTMLLPNAPGDGRPVPLSELSGFTESSRSAWVACQMNHNMAIIRMVRPVHGTGGSPIIQTTARTQHYLLSMQRDIQSVQIVAAV